jgi:hypothetical protein
MKNGYFIEVKFPELICMSSKVIPQVWNISLNKVPGSPERAHSGIIRHNHILVILTKHKSTVTPKPPSLPQLEA